MIALSGAEEAAARALFRLSARRGSFPFLPELGSRLHKVMGEKPSARQALAAQYAAEALEAEPDLKVTGVEWSEQDGTARVTVRLDWQGETLSVTVEA